MSARYLREARRDANYYALLCNIHGNGKRVWKAEDFLITDSDDRPHSDPEKAAAALAKYEEAMAMAREVQTTNHAVPSQ